MQVLAAAVTPVVLVSAAAILVGGVNSRYIAISDRMRALAQEYREESSSASRRSVIAIEMVTFKRRVKLVSWAVRALYAAVGCFTSVALMISAESWHKVPVPVSLPVFTLGIILIIAAIICQLLELGHSNRTLSLEIQDVER